MMVMVIKKWDGFVGLLLFSCFYLCCLPGAIADIEQLIRCVRADGGVRIWAEHTSGNGIDVLTSGHLEFTSTYDVNSTALFTYLLRPEGSLDDFGGEPTDLPGCDSNFLSVYNCDINGHNITTTDWLYFDFPRHIKDATILVRAGDGVIGFGSCAEVLQQTIAPPPIPTDSPSSSPTNASPQHAPTSEICFWTAETYIPDSIVHCYAADAFPSKICVQHQTVMNVEYRFNDTAYNNTSTTIDSRVVDVQFDCPSCSAELNCVIPFYLPPNPLCENSDLPFSASRNESPYFARDNASPSEISGRYMDVGTYSFDWDVTTTMTTNTTMPPSSTTTTVIEILPTTSFEHVGVCTGSEGSDVTVVDTSTR